MEAGRTHCSSKHRQNNSAGPLGRAAAGSWARVVKNPLQFIEEVRQETSKVTWPAWKEVWITTLMVLMMVALTSVFFLFTDMIISTLVQFVLGLGR